jgi:HSP20 family molecular chaperone IbpA
VDDELIRLFALEIEKSAFSPGRDREPPRTQIRVERNAYWFEVSVPVRSARQEDIRVEVRGRLLLLSYAPAADDISGVRTSADGKYGGRAEDIEEGFMLPKDAIHTDILASFEGGVLTVFVPRAHVQENSVTHQE